MTKALKPQCVFARIEKKYLLNVDTCKALLAGMKGRVTMDDYGKYTICNIYYDTEDYDLIRRSIDKPKYKEKLRLRSYGVPGMEDPVFLEIKKKWKKTVYKRRMPMKLKEADIFMSRGIYPGKAAAEDQQILKELSYFQSFYNPEPKLFLAYDRIAFAGVDDPELRITFDTGIRSRYDNLSLAAGDQGRPLLKKGWILMEIKAGEAFPIWLSELLAKLTIYPRSFSKYGSIYRRDKLSGTIGRASYPAAKTETGGQKICSQVS